MIQEMKRSVKEAEYRIERHNEEMERDSAGLFKYALSEETRQRLRETFGESGIPSRSF